MASLYQSAINARRGVIVVLVLLVLVLGIDTVSKLYEREALLAPSTPRFYMNANRIFDEIERPVIPGITTARNNTTVYTLTGFFEEDFPDVAYVYKIEEPREKLFAFEDAQAAVKLLGFDTNVPIENVDKGDGNYEWITANGSKTIKFNKIQQTWDLKTFYDSNVEAKKTKTLLSDIEAYQDNGSNLVDRLGFETIGIEDALIDVKFAKLQNGFFFRNDNYQEADYVFLNFFRKLRFADLKPKEEQPKIDNEALIPEEYDVYTYTSDPRFGQIKAVVSNSLTNYPVDVYELEFQNYEYSTSEKGAYLIISAEEAWSKIQLGQGSLVSIIPQGSNYFNNYATNLNVQRFSADRNRTKLGYWEPEVWTGFVYPIYIFEGTATLSDGRTAGFTYFVEAIKRIN
jgi:hypothetical protein